MFVFLSKLLPILVYPLGLACLLILLAVFLRGRARLQRAALLAALLLLWVGGNRWAAAGLARSLESRYPAPDPIPEAPAIVLMGGGTEIHEAPRAMVEVNSAGDRVIYAARLYREGKAEHILVSGGYLNWEPRPTTPAQDMADLLEWLGVHREAIWLQDRSQNTAEDAQYSAQILKEKGVGRILLVTSAWHMPRALRLFEAQGLEVIPVPSDYNVTERMWRTMLHSDWRTMMLNTLPNVGNLGLTTRMLKEYFGLFVYGLRGWGS